MRKRILTLATLTGVVISLVGCSEGGDSSSESTMPDSTMTFSIAGTVTGLLPGNVVVLQSGADTFSVAADGSFTMQTRQNNGSQYQVLVAAQPAGQTCWVFGGAGQVTADGSPQIDVTCEQFSLVAGAYSPLKSVGGLAADGSGNVYLTDTYRYAIFKVSPRGAVTLVAGIPGSPGANDGAVSTAQFGSLQGIATDGSGNLYVSDSHYSTIRKVSAAGLVSTVAGKAGERGLVDGVGASARFSSPQGLAIDAASTLYVADYTDNAVRKIKADGTVSTLLGASGTPGTCDGPLCLPSDIAVDAGGNVYVTSSVMFNITKVTADGKAQDINHMYAKGLAANAAGKLYRLVPANNWEPGTCVVCSIDSNGALANVAGDPSSPGAVDGIGAAAKFGYPSLVTADRTGNLYVYDTFNSSPLIVVRYSDDIAIRRITPEGRVSTLNTSAGIHGYVDGTGAVARFNRLGGVARDAAGNLYVSDSTVIRKITPSGEVSTLAGDPGRPGYTDARGSAARFNIPGALATDAAGTVYVLDDVTGTSSQHWVAVRKITSDGMVTTLVDTGFLLNSARGITLDGQGNLYIADTFSASIVKVTPDGSASRIAGMLNVRGDADGVGTAARFHYPEGIVADRAGNVYVADGGNNLIRKIAPNGAVTTVAGSSGNSGFLDGQGSAARFNFNGRATLTLDESGNLYVIEEANEAVRKIDTAGVVTTVRKSFPFGNGGTMLGRSLYAANETAIVKISLP